jgi:hypothetical protein
VGVALWRVGEGGVTEVEKECPVGACTKARIEREIEERDLETIQTGIGVSFALAGAAAITSAVLFAVGADGAEPAPQPAIRFGPGAVTFAGRF